VWKKAYEIADAEVRKCQAQVAERCEELGIPKQFAPHLGVYWETRGENMLAERRRELRSAAKARIEAIEKGAFVRIERASVEAQTKLLAHGVTSEAAKKFLARELSIEKLMPAIEVKSIEDLTDRKPGRRRAA